MGACKTYLVYGYKKKIEKIDTYNQKKVSELVEKADLKKITVEKEGLTEIVVGRIVSSTVGKTVETINPGRILRRVISIEDTKHLDKLEDQISINKEEPSLMVVAKHD